jgi:hypothetical protein
VEYGTAPHADRATKGWRGERGGEAAGDVMPYRRPAHHAATAARKLRLRMAWNTRLGRAWLTGTKPGNVALWSYVERHGPVRPRPAADRCGAVPERPRGGVLTIV